MTGRADTKLVIRRSGGGAQDGGGRAELKVQELAVGELDNLFAGFAEQGVGPHGAAYPAHYHGRRQTMAGDVTGDDPELAGRQYEQVIPVAPHVATFCRGVTDGDL